MLKLLIFTILLTSCTWHHTQAVQKPTPKTPVRVSVEQRFGKFTKVKINGAIDVYLHVGHRLNKVVFRGEAEDVVKAARGVNDGELYITMGKGYPKYGNIKVDIYMHNLTKFTYHGSGHVFAKGVTSQCVDLDIDNNQTTIFDRTFGISRARFSNVGYSKVYGVSGCVSYLTLMGDAKVKLNGFANIAMLKMSGGSELTINKVRSKTMQVKLKDTARAQLAGVTDTLYAELWDKSCLNSRYLMAQNTFVKTHNNSAAYIAAIKNQHTLAKDRSNIYYYFLPETKTNFMAKDGSVLDMREWTWPFMKSHTPYNK